MRSDHQLQQAVLEQLDCDPAINSSHVGVAVRDGVVTLSGHVPSLREERAAFDAAGRVKGVKAIVDRISVELPGECQTSDEVVAEQAHARLSTNAAVPIERIRLMVEDGVVTLRGEVPFEYQRRAAEEDLLRLACVRGLRNEIAIRPPVAAENVRQKIHAMLARVTPTQRDTIDVTAEGGRVTLRGTVNSWHERNQIENAAWSVPGVAEVVNEIAVG